MCVWCVRTWGSPDPGSLVQPRDPRSKLPHGSAQVSRPKGRGTDSVGAYACERMLSVRVCVLSVCVCVCLCVLGVCV